MTSPGFEKEIFPVTQNQPFLPLSGGSARKVGKHFDDFSDAAGE